MTMENSLFEEISKDCRLFLLGNLTKGIISVLLTCSSEYVYIHLIWIFRALSGECITFHLSLTTAADALK